MRSTVDQRLSLRPDERQELHDLAEELGLSINRTVARAIRGLRLMWEDTKMRAEVAEAQGPGRGELLKRVVCELGPGDVLLNQDVRAGVLADRRPAIETMDRPNNQSAIFYVDEFDRIVMQIRRDGKVDHFRVDDGLLRTLLDPEPEETAALT